MGTPYDKKLFNRQAAAAILLLLSTLMAAAGGSHSAPLWDIGGTGMFDGTDKAYQINDGRVTVSLSGQTAGCPTGLGHLVSGRASVKQIRFLFNVGDAGDYYLHVSWNPGGSGKEQFEVSCNASVAGKSTLVDAGKRPGEQFDEWFGIRLARGRNVVSLRHLSGDGLHFKSILMSRSRDLSALPLPLNPRLKYPTLQAFENAVKKPAVMLDGKNVRLFAPRAREGEAKAVFDYLVRAYDQLYGIVGTRTEFKIVVYHFPPGDPNGWGGTSNCTIWYSEKNLEFESDAEWKAYRVPHVCGYIEEMAHNFVHATRAQFGWEMVGWSIGTKATAAVADNPMQTRLVQNTRNTQERTFNRYVEASCTFPRDIAPNLCDRIHAHILFLCEKKYGPGFWPDFFREIRKERRALLAAARLGTADEVRNRRYQITVDCFGRLRGLDFKNMLERLQISTTTDVKSLHPERAGWNRKFTPPIDSQGDGS